VTVPVRGFRNPVAPCTSGTRYVTLQMDWALALGLFHIDAATFVPTSTKQQWEHWVNSNFKRLALLVHPDKQLDPGSVGLATRRFQQLREAREFLLATSCGNDDAANRSAWADGVEDGDEEMASLLRGEASLLKGVDVCALASVRHFLACLHPGVAAAAASFLPCPLPSAADQRTQREMDGYALELSKRGVALLLHHATPLSADADTATGTVFDRILDASQGGSGTNGHTKGCTERDEGEAAGATREERFRAQAHHHLLWAPSVFYCLSRRVLQQTRPDLVVQLGAWGNQWPAGDPTAGTWQSINEYWQPWGQKCLGLVRAAFHSSFLSLLSLFSFSLFFLSLLSPFSFSLSLFLSFSLLTLSLYSLSLFSLFFLLIDSFSRIDSFSLVFLLLLLLAFSVSLSFSSLYSLSLSRSLFSLLSFFSLSLFPRRAVRFRSPMLRSRERRRAAECR